MYLYLVLLQKCNTIYSMYACAMGGRVCIAMARRVGGTLAGVWWARCGGRRWVLLRLWTGGLILGFLHIKLAPPSTPGGGKLDGAGLGGETNPQPGESGAYCPLLCQQPTLPNHKTACVVFGFGSFRL